MIVISVTRTHALSMRFYSVKHALFKLAFWINSNYMHFRMKVLHWWWQHSTEIFSWKWGRCLRAKYGKD
jgi:hypothetical protein